jgi:hypothetical protein
MLCETSERAAVRKVGDQLVVPVPWHDAASLRTKLRRGGFFSEPIMGAGKREICLEMESLDEAGVRAAVSGWAARDVHRGGIPSGIPALFGLRPLLRGTRRTIMTSRTGLYTAFAGMAVSAVSTLAFLVPGLSEPGYPVSNLTAVGISLWMAGQLLGVLLILGGLLATAVTPRRKLLRL